MSRALVSGLFLASSLLLVDDCASPSGPRTILWESVPHGTTVGVSTIENDQLILENRQIRTAGTYAAPLTVECDVSPDASESSEFRIEFVPSVAPATSKEPQRCLVIRSARNQTNELGATSVTSWETPEYAACLFESDRKVFLLKTGEVYHVGLSLSRDHADIVLNTNDIGTVKGGVPYQKFCIVLSSLGVTNRWRVSKFMVH